MVAVAWAPTAALAHAAPARDLSEATGCGIPEWPRSSVRFSEAPQVELRLQLDRQGRVTALRVLKSTGVAAFDKAAMKALKTCRFIPVAGDRPQLPHAVSVVYRWHLD